MRRPSFVHLLSRAHPPYAQTPAQVSIDPCQRSLSAFSPRTRHDPARTAVDSTWRPDLVFDGNTFVRWHENRWQQGWKSGSGALVLLPEEARSCGAEPRVCI